MAYRLLTIILIAVLSIGCLTGCGNGGEEPIVKTDAEYEAQAEKEITEENVDDALDELEKEIEQDTD